MFEGATTEQAYAILAAAQRVIQSVLNPDDPRSGRGTAIVIAAGKLLFTPAVDVDPTTLPHIEPQDLGRAVGADRELAEHAAALIACARKLLIYANTVVQRGTPWTEKPAHV